MFRENASVHDSASQRYMPSVTACTTYKNNENTTGFENARTVVVKLGSAVLTKPGNFSLDLEVMDEVCRQLAEQVHAGRQVIVVTSAAVAAGRNLLQIFDRKTTIAEKQALAAVGQSRLMMIYSDLLAKHDLVAAQILLSLSDMESRKRYVNARYTIEELLKRRCIPIINENDTVTIDELKFGDNDGLAAMVAVKMQADALLLLSDVPGLYDANPKGNPEARLIPVVDHISQDVLKSAAPSDAERGMIQMGTGGMETKLQAARLATSNGVGTVIGPGKRAGVISQALSGVNVGTWFPAELSHHSRREKWILSARVNGRQLVIDSGARDALREKKRSLLPAGIRGVTGTFQALDLVDIVDQEGGLIARGIVNYSAGQLKRIAGKKSTDIEPILGAKPYDEAVHRDNLVVF